MHIRRLLATVLVALLTACGGGGGGGASGAGGGGGGPEPASPETLQESDLAVSAQVSDAAVPAGGTTTLTITVANNGAGTARGITLWGDLDVAITNDPDLKCTATGGAVCPREDGNGDVPDIPAGGRLTFTGPLVLGDDARGPINSTFLAVASNDGKTGDNFAVAVVQAYKADVSVSGRGPAGPVQAGLVTSYEMTVLNAGPDDARDVAIENRAGPSQLVQSISCAAAGGATCPASLGSSMRVPRLPANASLRFTITVQVAPGYSGGLDDVMRVTAAGDRNPNNNVAAVQASAYVAASVGQTSVTLQSDPGDFVGGGRSYAYTRANAVLSFTPSGGTLRVQVTGDQNWAGEIDLPSGVTLFVPGTYTNLTRAPFRNAAVGGLEWTGEGRGCNTLLGSVTVNSVAYDGAALTALDLDFEQHCEGVPAALRGHLVWVASDATTPPGPVTPPPAGLWAPAAGVTPAGGSYVYLQGDTGDFVGQGITATYTRVNSLLSVAAQGTTVSVNVAGDQNWRGDFVGMNSLALLQPGYYGGLIRYPFHNPVKGGLSWSGEGRGCNTLTGWMVVDSVTWNGTSLAALDLRFEQHCEGAGPALHGKIHWDASDTSTPFGPVTPVPSTLWSPPAGATPASGNYLFLSSQPGDYIGQGVTTTITPIGVYGGTGNVNVSGGGWFATFQAMDSLAQLQPGYYGDLRRYPFHNHAKGGLDFSGNGRGCNTLAGWFAVDNVAYDAGGLAAIDLRFEQHCEGAAAALRGKVHWAR